VPAADLRACGLALCKPDPDSKSPKYKGWPTRSLEPADFGPTDLYGIIAGPLSDGNQPGYALVIIDLDDPLVLANADEFLPATGMEEGREGKDRDHRYFLVRLDSIPAWALSTAQQAAPAAQRLKGHPGPCRRAFNHRETKKRLIDFLGTGGQAVCPSPGNERRWVGGQPGAPALVTFDELWEAVCRLAEACGGALPFTPGDGPAGDDLITRRVVPYLAKCEPAISGQGGHNTTFSVARAVCWGFDLGAELGFQVLWQHYNPRCQPPWSEQELRHKCHDAVTQSYSKPRGWLLSEDPAAAGGGQGQPKRPDAYALIREWLKEHYDPSFPRGDGFHSSARGRDFNFNQACRCSKEIIDRLTKAADAPRDDKGRPKRRALLKLFADWVKPAVADLIRELPPEPEAVEISPHAAAEFRRKVAQVLHHHIPVGVTSYINGQAEGHQERRPLIQWCCDKEFCQVNKWSDIRGYRIWTRKEPNGQIRVAMHPVLFGQVPGGDKELAKLGPQDFGDLCELYHIGRGSLRLNKARVVELETEFLAEQMKVDPHGGKASAPEPPTHPFSPRTGFPDDRDMAGWEESKDDENKGTGSTQ
jgi:hypothetical protein